MPIPSRKDLYDTASKTNTSPNDTVKQTLEKATIDAVNKLKAVMNSNDANPADQIRAAQQIIQMAHGKDGLRLEEEKTDAAKAVVEAINRSRNPVDYDALLIKFTTHHEAWLSDDNLNPTHLLESFIQAIKNPTEYFLGPEDKTPDSH